MLQYCQKLFICGITQMPSINMTTISAACFFFLSKISLPYIKIIFSVCFHSPSNISKVIIIIKWGFNKIQAQKCLA